MRFVWIVKSVLLLGVCVTLLQGCSNYKGSDEAEQRHPTMRKAARFWEQQEAEKAVALYEQLLRRQPDFANAHLQLGWIYEQKRDYVRTVYHLQQYLDLRPDGMPEKLDAIQDMIAHARARLADGGPVRIPSAPTDVSDLLTANEDLRRRNHQLEEELEDARERLSTFIARLEASGVDLEAVLGAMPTPVPAPTQAKQYVVQPGDTLSSISTKLYQDPKAWKKIFNANKHQLSGGEDRLRVGQTLTIP